MPEYKVGDTVVHSTYGSGKIVVVADKGLPGAPCFYYVIETGEQTLWVPAEEEGSSSLHLPASGPDFKRLIALLRSPAENLSDNSYQRRDQLAKKMQKASPRDLCLVIRDLTSRSQSRDLSSSDKDVLNRAELFLLDEWQRSLGTGREKARTELGWILREIESNHRE
jgi:RNA polymerase-interacting CarD/CdnL/TRCF family regulator